MTIKDLRKIADMYGATSPVAFTYNNDGTWNVSVGMYRATAPSMEEAVDALHTQFVKLIETEIRNLKARLEELSK